MDSMVRKRFIAISLILLLLLTACGDSVFDIKKEIENNAELMMDAFISQNVDDLFNFFSEDIRNDREEETKAEIQDAFNFIDGKIVSYSYHEGGGMASKEDGKMCYYSAHLDFNNVITDTGHTYTIEFSYIHIYDEKPEREGVYRLIIKDAENSDNQISAGINYTEYYKD